MSRGRERGAGTHELGVGRGGELRDGEQVEVGGVCEPLVDGLLGAGLGQRRSMHESATYL